MIDKHPQSTAVIRFQDCDAFAHLNNAQYIHYFINAREDHLRTYYQFDLYQHAQHAGANWVITKHEIVYLRPALLGEVVTITTSLIDLTPHGLTVEGIMWDETGRQLKAVQWTQFRYINLRDGRPTTHPPDVAQLLQRILVDAASPETLDERIRQIKRRQRTPTPAAVQTDTL